MGVLCMVWDVCVCMWSGMCVFVCLHVYKNTHEWMIRMLYQKRDYSPLLGLHMWVYYVRCAVCVFACVRVYTNIHMWLTKIKSRRRD